MTSHLHRTCRISAILLCALAVGCERNSETSKSTSSTEQAKSAANTGDSKSVPTDNTSAQPGDAKEASASLPAEHPPVTALATQPPDPHGTATNPHMAQTSSIENGKLTLTGLTMAVPSGWVAEPVFGAGPMAPKAILQIPNAEGNPGSVRITHFPGMKRMNEPNISRWLGQVRRPDGTSATRDDATISTETIGPVQLTRLDASGTIKATMRAAPQKNQRMIATIIDHPKGPHFVVIIGEKALIDANEAVIDTFLKSATVVE